MLLAIAALSGIIADLSIMFYKETPYTDAPSARSSPVMSIIRNSYFKRLWVLECMFFFAMSIAWPYFSVVMIRRLHASKFEIAIQSMLLFSLGSIIQFFFGGLADRFGRKPVLAASRTALPSYPLLFMLATHMGFIYVAAVIAGICNGLWMLASTASILDITREEERASAFAVFNTAIGFATFFGSLLGGLLGEFLTQFYGVEDALIAVLLLSFTLKLASSLLYVTTKETRTPGRG